MECKFHFLELSHVWFHSIKFTLEIWDWLIYFILDKKIRQNMSPMAWANPAITERVQCTLNYLKIIKSLKLYFRSMYILISLEYNGKVVSLILAHSCISIYFTNMYCQFWSSWVILVSIFLFTYRMRILLMTDIFQNVFIGNGFCNSIFIFAVILIPYVATALWCTNSRWLQEAITTQTAVNISYYKYKQVFLTGIYRIWLV